MKFRPQLICTKHRLKHPGNYSFVEHHHISETKLRIFAQLHYLGSHSPLYKKWHNVERKYLNRYRRSSELF